ncbi:uncharacterized protein cep295 isoform X2 [Halichoeres trimaculatus]|uniref:uncharacterized protein cep295 isoform X2 n=1 Tax=Halichoeres trimaculatus TaxID=147232 RepID=UPI003D9F0A77
MEMKRKVGKLRLSPNEEARIIREEHERRRKLRIQQVREQQRYIALHIRQEVEQRRQRELEKLGEELRADWERQQREKLDTLQKLYQESLQLLGQGHRSAKENEVDLAAVAQREEENHAKAVERHREALKELKSQKLKDHERQSRLINARKKALQTEKERAAKVASLPPPPPNPIQSIDPRKSHVVKKCDVSAFGSTHYHMPESSVDREEEVTQSDAREEAELEVRRLEDLQREKQRRREEQLERARLRGKQALRREHRVQDRERLLVELEHMQQTDLLRRRQQVALMPPQIFQPLYKRQEMREDFQRELEFAFEDMYTGERRVKGDLVVQLVPEPLPALSTGSQDRELDVTQDELTTSGAEDAQREAESTEQETSAPESTSRPAPRRALRKLLDRIRSQRNQWTEQSSSVPAADSPPLITDQIPERDTTIDTGSLTSEEKGSPPPVQIPVQIPEHESSQSESAEAETSHPDGLFSRIQEFEEERKKRDEELEQEKQQQLALLQELEEQKAKLEQLLQEAQREREHLKAAGTQEVSAVLPEVLITPPEPPVQDQESTCVTPGVTETAPPAGEEGHSSRIREYQQRLLERNRIHQRSVQVARQRLEEYQRALQIRHSMAAASLSSGFIPPPPHGAASVQPPAPPQLLMAPVDISSQPQTSEEAPTRESDSAPSPLRPAGSRSLSGDLESIGPADQRRDVTARLTDSIMERATRHLTEQERPSVVTAEPPPNKPATSHPAPSDTSQSSSQRSTGEAPHLSGDMERQRRELQEVQRRFVAQRESLALQQRQQEEEKQRRSEEKEQMRRQKETLQALIQTDSQLVPGVASEALDSEDVGQTRLRILASLLRAIEESNRETLSRLEENPEEEDRSDQHGETELIPQSEVPAGPPPPPPSLSVLSPVFLPRTAKPPVTRVRPGIMQIMTEQHELSAIQEVETPVNISLVAGPEESVTAPPDEDSGSAESDRSLHTPSLSFRGQQTSSQQAWRERLLTGAGSSPEPSESDSVLRMISALSSDSGRGADFSGAAATGFRSPTESAHRPPDSDSLSSTTISTGSYITTDPEQNVNSDKPPPLRHFAERGQPTGFLLSSPPSDQSVDGSVAARPGPSIESVFNDSSIQDIIDRYARELNISLNTTGKTSDSEGSSMEDPGPSVSQRSVLSVSASSRVSSARQSPAAAQETSQESKNQLLEYSTLEDQDQDSFRPLIGQLADQSSCLADHRDSTMEQLVGLPSAHSSMIGQPAGPAVSVSFDQGGWDSTLTRMIGRLSHASSSHWLSGGRDFYAGQLIGEMPSGLSYAGLEESQMRPLVGELDESAGQNSGSSGEKTHIPVEVSVPSYPALPPEASSHSASVPDTGTHPQEQTLRDQTGLTDQDAEHTEAFPDSDSFHPLLAEVTHNETADPSMTFHHPDQSVLNSPEGRSASGERSPSTPSERSETHNDPSAESEASPERLRAEDPSSCMTAHESFAQLHLQDSVCTARTDVELTALSEDALLREEEDAASTRFSDKDLVQFSKRCIEEPEADQAPDSHVMMDTSREKGILEQSEITLVSLTDTTLQDQETTITEEEEEEGRRDQELEEWKQSEAAEDDKRTHPETLLDVQWGPGRSLQDVCQQKCRALLLRSSQRVEAVKAKAALAKKQPKIQKPPKARETSVATGSRPITCRDETKPERQHKTTAETPGSNSQGKPQPPLPGAESRLKESEVKLCTPEQRKKDAAERHRRTQRLYEQLEEVKQQKAMRSRQEAYAKNRLKAKEFHMKTLQKLRAKQTQH